MIRLIQRLIKETRTRVYDLLYSLVIFPVQVRGIAENNSITLGKRLKGRRIRVIFTGRNSSLVIGDNVAFYGDRIELWVMGNSSHMSIGDGVSIHDGSHLVSGEDSKLFVGSGCLIGPNVHIRGSDSHKIYKDGERINKDDSIWIGSRVWIGEGATILKGTSVLDDSVVGTKSVASGAYSTGELLVGIPARAINHNITWEH